MAAMLERYDALTDSEIVGNAIERDGAVIVEGLLTDDVVGRINDEVAAVGAADPEEEYFNPVMNAFHGPNTRQVAGMPGISPTFAAEVMSSDPAGRLRPLPRPFMRPVPAQSRPLAATRARLARPDAPPGRGRLERCPQAVAGDRDGVGWLRTEENNYLSCPPEAAATLPRQAQELLGYAVHDAIPRGGGYLGMVRMQDPVDLIARGEL